METSRITSKHQATVPADVRITLGLKAPDTIAWEVDERGGVRVRKARLLDIVFASAVATLDEWGSPEDEAAWRDL